MSDYAREVVALIKATMQQRHVSGKYAISGHPAETRLLPSGKRAQPLHRAIAQQTPKEEDQDDDSA